MTEILRRLNTDISRQLPASLLGDSAATKELWWMNQEWLEFRWGSTVDQKMAAVHGTLCTIPPCNSNNTSAFPLDPYVAVIEKVSQQKLCTYFLYPPYELHARLPNGPLPPPVHYLNWHHVSDLYEPRGSVLCVTANWTLHSSLLDTHTHISAHLYHTPVIYILPLHKRHIFTQINL
jgi:hypothetical protein